ncbi:MAG: 16S rRNA (cytosine1402-N4)-methyltransferase [Candidatus Krumholzibacteriia bacterium]|jgi:16S rRNA (cytosine1402-N4)-methyltransferase
MTDELHIPVLKDESLGFLEPGPGRRIVDGTFGFGGHTSELLAAGAEVLGLDLDAVAFGVCETMQKTEPNLVCGNESFRYIDRALAAVSWDKVDGVLLDLGVSSFQLDDAQKGFSYRADGPLDLRFDQTSGRTAAEMLADMTAEEIADLIWQFGEERGSRRIARAIVTAREEEAVTTTTQLREIVRSVLPRSVKSQPTLSRVFQALRIAVNHELDALEEVLGKLAKIVKPGGVFVVISYHSLEDRMVKKFIDRERRDCLCPVEIPVCVCGHQHTLKALTRRAVVATKAEESRNVRSRSARLRAAQVV